MNMVHKSTDCMNLFYTGGKRLNFACFGFSPSSSQLHNILSTETLHHSVEWFTCQKQQRMLMQHYVSHLHKVNTDPLTSCVSMSEAFQQDLKRTCKHCFVLDALARETKGNETSHRECFKAQVQNHKFNIMIQYQ